MAVTAPPTRRPPEAIASIDLQPQRWVITLEQLLYVGLALMAVICHLYLLGDRALHHDETHHANYSWIIYQGRGYQHDPLLHGPFLYYLTAFGYFLFGDSDFTARLGAAIFGIALTLLPALLRRDLGPGTALLASTYLLISPVALYVGRFIRHDIFAAVFELLSVIAILRYVATERPLWHYTLAAAMALMLTTMESFYLFLAIIGSFVVVWVLWQVARWTLALLLGYAAVAVVALKGLTRLPGIGPIPLPTPEQALQVRHQPDNDLITYFANVGGVLVPLFSHPAGLMLLVSTVLLAALLVFFVFVRPGPDGRAPWRREADVAPSGSLVGALDRIPGRQWVTAFVIAFVIYAVLYTGIISNPLTANIAALITGVSGSFLYWLGQHGVQRGNQPGHYYLFLLSVYEPLLLVFGTVGVGTVLRQLLRVRRRAEDDGAVAVEPGRVDDEADTLGQRRVMQSAHALLGPALLAWWSLGALAIYSWAGEKMPWLTLHVSLPLTLLSAWAVARLWSWAAQGDFDGLALGLTAMTGVLLLLTMNRFTATIRASEAVAQAGLWPLLACLFVGLLLVGLALIYGSARQPVLALLSLLLVFGTMFTVRSSLRLAYVNGDVPVEPMVFVQTSPDVARVMDRLRTASRLRTGKLSLPIRYDNETIWVWYLRNYTQVAGSGGTVIEEIDEEVQAVFLLSENVPANEANLESFVRQEYPLRWWFPECEVYRIPGRDRYCGANPDATSLLSRLLSRPWNGQALADYWNFWFNRRLPAPLGSTNWTLFVRPELAAEFGIGAGSAR